MTPEELDEQQRAIHTAWVKDFFALKRADEAALKRLDGEEEQND